MRGWLALLMTLVLLGSSCWLFFRPHLSSNSAPNARVAKQADISGSQAFMPLEQFVETVEHQMPPLVFKNPLYARQGYYLRRWVIQCVWDKMTSQAALPQTIVWSKTASYQYLCADDLLDQFLDDGEFALALAQALKSIGVELPPSYDDVPTTWPVSLSNSYASKKFARAVGHT